MLTWLLSVFRRLPNDHNASDDSLFQADAVKVLEIYWKDQIDIPVIQWLYRIPYNQTYWTNRPTKENPAGGTNDAFWAHTGMLVITQLKAIQ